MHINVINVQINSTFLLFFLKKMFKISIFQSDVSSIQKGFKVISRENVWYNQTYFKLSQQVTHRLLATGSCYIKFNLKTIP